MPKNLRGGKGHKKGKNNTNTEQQIKVVYAEEDQVYAMVKNKLGGKRLAVECSDGKDRIALIPGRFRKRVWMNPGDVILCSVESIGNDSICYIDRKYKNYEIGVLRNKGYIHFENLKEENIQNDDEGFSFKNDNTPVKTNEKSGYDDMMFPDSDIEDDDVFYNPNKGMNPSKRNNDNEGSDDSDSIDLNDL
jgi:translation initiation factor 1A